MQQHQENAKQTYGKSFAGRYNAYFLIYYEYFECIEQAIAREKEVKGWRRSKKEELMYKTNPDWEFLNDKIE